MACACGKTIKITSTTETADTITLIASNTPDLYDLEKFKLIICTRIPMDAGTKQVIVQIGAVDINLLGVFGDYIRADQIKCRRCYPVVYGNDPVHLSMLCKVNRSEYTTPTPGASQVLKDE